MVYVFLAQGFEEIEALAVVDILRRAELEVKTVGVTGEIVGGSHGIVVACDTVEGVIDPSCGGADCAAGRDSRHLEPGKICCG